MRGWIQLSALVFGGGVSLQNYRKQQAQQRLNNSFLNLDRFKHSLQKEDLKVWKQIVLASSESVGVEPGYFKYYDTPYRLSDLFISEGQGLVVSNSQGDESINYGGAIRRIAEQLDFIGYQSLYGNVDLKIIYFELGQLMDTLYQWLGVDNLYDSYPSFSQMYKLNQRKFENWFQKSYAAGC